MRAAKLGGADRVRKVGLARGGAARAQARRVRVVSLCNHRDAERHDRRRAGGAAGVREVQQARDELLHVLAGAGAV